MRLDVAGHHVDARLLGDHVGVADLPAEGRRRLGAVAQRLAASLTPHALMKKRITIEDYLASKYICEPLHLFDYCLINDGGVVLIITEAARDIMEAAGPILAVRDLIGQSS